MMKLTIELNSVEDIASFLSYIKDNTNSYPNINIKDNLTLINENNSQNINNQINSGFSKNRKVLEEFYLANKDKVSDRNCLDKFYKYYLKIIEEWKGEFKVNTLWGSWIVKEHK